MCIEWYIYKDPHLEVRTADGLSYCAGLVSQAQVIRLGHINPESSC